MNFAVTPLVLTPFESLSEHPQAVARRSGRGEGFAFSRPRRCSLVSCVFVVSVVFLRTRLAYKLVRAVMVIVLLWLCCFLCSCVFCRITSCNIIQHTILYYDNINNNNNMSHAYDKHSGKASQRDYIY